MNKPTTNFIDRELKEGEQLLWHGVPEQGIRFKGGDLFLIPFSLLWCGFAIFWEYSVLSSSNSPFFFKLWGIPFILMGIYIVFGRFIVDSYVRASTFYGVTSNRILISQGIFQKRLTILSLKTRNDLTLIENSNGIGSIIFGSSTLLNGMFRGTGWPGINKNLAPAFEDIKNVKTVFDIIEKNKIID